MATDQAATLNPTDPTRRASGLLEQTVAPGAAGRAVCEIRVVRRGPVNGDVMREK